MKTSIPALKLPRLRPSRPRSKAPRLSRCPRRRTSRLMWPNVPIRLEAEGKPPATAPAERVNRYQEALEQARQETDRARSENGLGRDGFDAQIEQAALAQE